VILLDASIWLAAVDESDAFHSQARALVTNGDIEHAALDLTVYEVGHVASVRWGDVAQARRLCRLLFVACAERLLPVTPDLADAAVGLAEQHRITVYDAAYVAAARREGCPLVSGDVADLVGRGLAIAPDAISA
jgi:predicted nucleic acid-binding protein